MIPQVRTPQSIDDVVIKFCSEIVVGAVPRYITITPEPDSLPNECYENVRKYTAKFGGRKIYGWQIWILPGALIEAECHSIWVSPNGEYKCVTPRLDSEVRIVFIEDPLVNYAGVPIDNRRVVLNNSSYGKVIKAKGEAEYALRMRYFDGQKSNIPMSKMIELGQYEMSLFANEMLDPLNDLPEEVISMVQMMNHNIGAPKVVGRGNVKIGVNEPCPCGSGRKYKKCCLHRGIFA